MNTFEKLKDLENKATAFGFNWENANQILEQIKSECDEIKEDLERINLNKLKLQEEIGDLMHAIFSLCIFCKYDTEETLTKSIVKFEKRFSNIKILAQRQGLINLRGKTFDELMHYWNEAKKMSCRKI